MKKKIFSKIIALVLLITLCAAGLPAQKAQAAEKNVQTAVIDELDRPVITKLKNTYRNIQITWDKVEGADYYCIYRKQTYNYNNLNDKDWEKIAETKTCGYTDEIFRSELKYYYKVRAVRIEGNDKIISPVSKEKYIYRLSKPLFNVANANKHIRVSVREAYGDYLGMIVYRKGPGETSYTRIYKGKAITFRDTDVVEGKTYSYKICTYRGSSKSAVSKEKTITREKP